MSDVIPAHHGVLKGAAWTPAAGLYRWWYGDSLTDGKWTDRSGNGGHATLFGAPTVDADGLNLTGSHQYATAGDICDGFAAFSIVGWVRPTISWDTRVIISKRAEWSATGIPFELQIFNNGTTLYGFTPGAVGFVSQTPNMALNVWYHVAFVWTGSVARVGTDGTYGADVSKTVALTDNDVAVNIGRVVGGGGAMIGNINDLMIFSTALTALQIADIRANSPGKPT